MTDHRLTPEECRIGRAALGWSQEELGRAAGLDFDAVRAFEDAGEDAAAEKVAAAFTDAGITFHLDPDGRAFMKVRTLDGIIEAPVALVPR